MPINNPAKPIHTITRFFDIKTARDNPDVKCHRVQHSRNAGIVSPNVDSVNAPINDIKSSKFGIATASRTGRKYFATFLPMFIFLLYTMYIHVLTRYANNDCS